MVHVHSHHSRMLRRTRAIEKGFITAAKSCVFSAGDCAISVHGQGSPCQSGEDPWNFEDPWSKALGPSRNREWSHECELPPCPPPAFPPGLELKYCEAVKCAEDFGEIDSTTRVENALLRRDALPFVPAGTFSSITQETLQNTRELLRSAMALIEAQNNTIAHLRSSVEELQNSTGAKNINATARDLETAKQEWKVEVDKMLSDVQSVMREVLDKKDKEIEELRSAIGAAAHLQEQPCVEDTFVEKSPVNDEDRNWMKVNFREDWPTEWVPILKRELPVVARCAYCLQSLDSNAELWNCMKCDALVHACEGFQCKPNHNCANDELNHGATARQILMVPS